MWSISKGWILVFSRYSHIWEKHFAQFNVLNFGIGGDHTENALRRSNNLPSLSTLKHVIILCRTNNLYKDPPSKIVDGFNASFCPWKKCNNPKNVCVLLPRDESWSLNRIITKEINELLKYKCFHNNFLFVDQCSGWTQENGDFDYL